MSDRTITGTVVDVRHAGTSAMGNPTYRVELDDGAEYLTKVDSSIGYAATNYLPGNDGPQRVTLHLTGAGRVWNITEEG